ncbi:glucosaminidase domain-containing protein [Niallia circulans]|uniref:glucosaminidase domain-containing protein n=1 Tax=Niallia circulans TaxID=1397 RepID=UPI0026839A25
MSFINEILPHAKKVGKESNILVSLILAQAIHESNWGKSGLAQKGKNLFGIKGTYNGQSVTMKTWEVYNGKSVYVDAKFRKYPSWYESLRDLTALYENGVSWDRNKYKKVIGEKDYKAAAKAVQAAGYATDPNYAIKLIRTIEDNNLTQYDVDGVKVEKPKKTTSSTKDNVKTYQVTKQYNGYATAADAKSKKDKKTTVPKGKYYVFNESQGMINVTTKKGVPGSWINPFETTAKTTKAKHHIVKNGENLTKIAKNHKTSVAAIQKLNPSIKNPDLIYPKQKIRIK